MLLAHAERKQQPAHEPVNIQPSAGVPGARNSLFAGRPEQVSRGASGRGLEPLLRKKGGEPP